MSRASTCDPEDSKSVNAKRSSGDGVILDKICYAPRYLLVRPLLSSCSEIAAWQYHYWAHKKSLGVCRPGPGMVTNEKITLEQIKSWTTETNGFDVNRQKRLGVQVARHRVCSSIGSYFRKCVIVSIAVLMLNGFVMPWRMDRFTDLNRRTVFSPAERSEGKLPLNLVKIWRH